MSETELARTFHIPLAALREWEHHLREPDETALAYLEVIAHEPDAVRRALSAKPAKARKAA